MSLKVKVPKKIMRSASSNAHNGMNDTKSFRIGYSTDDLYLSNDTRSFLVISQ